METTTDKVSKFNPPSTDHPRNEFTVKVPGSYTLTDPLTQDMHPVTIDGEVLTVDAYLPNGDFHHGVLCKEGWYWF